MYIRNTTDCNSVRAAQVNLSFKRFNVLVMNRLVVNRDSASNVY